MSFENIQTQYINWAPVPTGGVSSKGPLNHLNVSDGVGGWLDSNSNINPATQHMGNINQITNIGNLTDFQVSTDGSIRLDAPGALQIGNAPGTISYELPTDPPTAIGQTLVAQSSGPSSVITWSNDTLGSNISTSINFLDSATSLLIATANLNMTRVGSIVCIQMLSFITSDFSSNGSFMAFDPSTTIPIGFRPNFFTTLPCLYATPTGGLGNLYSSHNIQFNSNGTVVIVAGNSDGPTTATGGNDGWFISGANANFLTQCFTYIGA
jgi:hypothetical protein